MIIGVGITDRKSNGNAVEEGRLCEFRCATLEVGGGVEFQFVGAGLHGVGVEEGFVGSSVGVGDDGFQELSLVVLAGVQT